MIFRAYLIFGNRLLKLQSLYGYGRISPHFKMQNISNYDERRLQLKQFCCVDLENESTRHKRRQIDVVDFCFYRTYHSRYQLRRHQLLNLVFAFLRLVTKIGRGGNFGSGFSVPIYITGPGTNIRWISLVWIAFQSVYREFVSLKKFGSSV